MSWAQFKTIRTAIVVLVARGRRLSANVHVENRSQFTMFVPPEWLYRHSRKSVHTKCMHRQVGPVHRVYRPYLASQEHAKHISV